MKSMKYLVIVIILIFIISSTGCGIKKDTPEEANTEANAKDVIPDESSQEQIQEPADKPSSETSQASKSVVYMTKEISPESLVRIYETLDREAAGKVAVKVHMGEPGGNNYLKPELVKDLVLAVGGTFVDCNTAYGGLRASTAAHLQAAEDHGFTEYASVDILDSEGAVSLPIAGGKHLTEDLVGSHYENYDFIIVLSHFKGHAMGGFGGAIKNMSIGFASPEGKNMIHNAGTGNTNKWLGGGYSQDEFLESMAEAAKAIVDDAGENILYISIMNNLSVDCDCDSSPAAPVMEDIGILASLDPVALDRACVDQVYASDETTSASLRRRIESKNGTHTLDYAEELGIGSQAYELVMIDE